jgi:hypothetical protein
MRIIRYYWQVHTPTPTPTQTYESKVRLLDIANVRQCMHPIFIHLSIYPLIHRVHRSTPLNTRLSPSPGPLDRSCSRTSSAGER